MRDKTQRKGPPGRIRKALLAGVGVTAGLLAFGAAPSFAQSVPQGAFKFAYPPGFQTFRTNTGQPGQNLNALPSATSLAAISVPGMYMTQIVPANGTQDYQCRTNSTGFGWAFTGPRASLFDPWGDQVGDHFNLQGTPQAGTPADGPRWRFNDGTQVRGRLVASAPGRTANDIPVLLIRVEYESRRAPNYTSYFGGAVQNAAFITRNLTVGGVAPAASSCNVNTVGQIAQVPYQATYFFWSPPPPPPPAYIEPDYSDQFIS